LVEKEALFDAVHTIISEVFPFGVFRLIATKGYDSATNVYEVAEALKAIKSEGKTPVVLAFGDYDPNPHRYPT